MRKLIPLFVGLVLYGCEANIATQEMTRADSCFMTTGVLTYERDTGIPTDGVTAEHLACLKKLGNEGDQQAAWYLVNFYQRGQVVEQSPEQYAYWLQKLADKGDATAQGYLGIALMNGYGIAEDREKAVTLLAKAHVAGQLQFRSLYLMLLVESVDHDHSWPIAVAIIDQGMKENRPWAFEYSALMTLGGFGVTKDINKAIEHFNKAGELGDKGAYIYLGAIYLNGYGVPQDLKMATDYLAKGGHMKLWQVLMDELNNVNPDDGVYQNLEYADDPAILLRYAAHGERDGNYSLAYEQYQKLMDKRVYFAVWMMDYYQKQGLVHIEDWDQAKINDQKQQLLTLWEKTVVTSQLFAIIMEGFAQKNDLQANRFMAIYFEDILKDETKAQPYWDKVKALASAQR